MNKSRRKGNSMSVSRDCELMVIYMQGFSDSLKGNLNNEFEEKSLAWYAYNKGDVHALLGDELSSIDTMTREEILKEIYEAFTRGNIQP